MNMSSNPGAGNTPEPVNQQKIIQPRIIPGNERKDMPNNDELTDSTIADAARPIPTSALPPADSKLSSTLDETIAASRASMLLKSEFERLDSTDQFEDCFKIVTLNDNIKHVLITKQTATPMINVQLMTLVERQTDYFVNLLKQWDPVRGKYFRTTPNKEADPITEVPMPTIGFDTRPLMKGIIDGKAMSDVATRAIVSQSRVPDGSRFSRSNYYGVISVTNQNRDRHQIIRSIFTEDQKRMIHALTERIGVWGDPNYVDWEFRFNDDRLIEDKALFGARPQGLTGDPDDTVQRWMPNRDIIEQGRLWHLYPARILIDIMLQWRERGKILDYPSNVELDDRRDVFMHDWRLTPFHEWIWLNTDLIRPIARFIVSNMIKAITVSTLEGRALTENLLKAVSPSLTRISDDSSLPKLINSAVGKDFLDALLAAFMHGGIKLIMNMDSLQPYSINSLLSALMTKALVPARFLTLDTRKMINNWLNDNFLALIVRDREHFVFYSAFADSPLSATEDFLERNIMNWMNGVLPSTAFTISATQLPVVLRGLLTWGGNNVVALRELGNFQLPVTPNTTGPVLGFRHITPNTSWGNLYMRTRQNEIMPNELRQHFYPNRDPTFLDLPNQTNIQYTAVWGPRERLTDTVASGATTPFDLQKIPLGWKMIKRALDIMIKAPVTAPTFPNAKTVDGTSMLQSDGIDKRRVQQMAAAIRVMWNATALVGSMSGRIDWITRQMSLSPVSYPVEIDERDRRLGGTPQTINVSLNGPVSMLFGLDWNNANQATNMNWDSMIGSGYNIIRACNRLHEMKYIIDEQLTSFDFTRGEKRKILFRVMSVEANKIPGLMQYMEKLNPNSRALDFLPRKRFDLGVSLTENDRVSLNTGWFENPSRANVAQDKPLSTIALSGSRWSPDFGLLKFVIEPIFSRNRTFHTSSFFWFDPFPTVSFIEATVKYITTARPTQILLAENPLSLTFQMFKTARLENRLTAILNNSRINGKPVLFKFPIQYTFNEIQGFKRWEQTVMEPFDKRPTGSANLSPIKVNWAWDDKVLIEYDRDRNSEVPLFYSIPFEVIQSHWYFPSDDGFIPRFWTVDEVPTLKDPLRFIDTSSATFLADENANSLTEEVFPRVDTTEFPVLTGANVQPQTLP